jgi:hypothetical protein
MAENVFDVEAEGDAIPNIASQRYLAGYVRRLLKPSHIPAPKPFTRTN